MPNKKRVRKSIKEEKNLFVLAAAYDVTKPIPSPDCVETVPISQSNEPVKVDVVEPIEETKMPLKSRVKRKVKRKPKVGRHYERIKPNAAKDCDDVPKETEVLTDQQEVEFDKLTELIEVHEATEQRGGLVFTPEVKIKQQQLYELELSNQLKDITKEMEPFKDHTEIIMEFDEPLEAVTTVQGHSGDQRNLQEQTCALRHVCIPERSETFKQRTQIKRKVEYSLGTSDLPDNYVGSPQEVRKFAMLPEHGGITKVTEILKDHSETVGGQVGEHSGTMKTFENAPKEKSKDVNSKKSKIKEAKKKPSLSLHKQRKKFPKSRNQEKNVFLLTAAYNAKKIQPVVCNSLSGIKPKQKSVTKNNSDEHLQMNVDVKESRETQEGNLPVGILPESEIKEEMEELCIEIMSEDTEDSNDEFIEATDEKEIVSNEMKRKIGEHLEASELAQQHLKKPKQHAISKVEKSAFSQEKKQHLTSLERPNSVPSTSSHDPPKSKSMFYECEECGYQFISSKNLEKHIECHYRKEQKKLDKSEGLICLDCNINFTRISTFKAHRWLLHDVEKHQCSKCPAQFESKSNLEEHFKHTHNKSKRLGIKAVFKFPPPKDQCFLVD